MSALPPKADILSAIECPLCANNGHGPNLGPRLLRDGIVWTGAQVVLALFCRDRQIVDAGNSSVHRTSTLNSHFHCRKAHYTQRSISSTGLFAKLCYPTKIWGMDWQR